MKKRLTVVALSLIFVILVGVLFFRDAEKPSILEQSPSLKSIFGGEDCENACWKDFEPFVASRDEVESWLGASGQSYSVVTMGRENDTLLWHDTNESLLLEPLAKDPIRISMEFSAEDILWRVALLDIHLCLKTIIEAYGLPRLIDVDWQNVRISYPNEGLLFNLHEGDTGFSSMFITSAEWVEYFSSSDNRSWEEVQVKLNAIMCNDAFTPK